MKRMILNFIKLLTLKQAGKRTTRKTTYSFFHIDTYRTCLIGKFKKMRMSPHLWKGATAISTSLSLPSVIALPLRDAFKLSGVVTNGRERADTSKI